MDADKTNKTRQDRQKDKKGSAKDDTTMTLFSFFHGGAKGGADNLPGLWDNLLTTKGGSDPSMEREQTDV